jgi:hypothetical protein
MDWTGLDWKNRRILRKLTNKKAVEEAMTLVRIGSGVGTSVMTLMYPWSNLCLLQ